MSEQPYALHVVVRGRVQGVAFRDFVITRALSIGLTGYVRNLPDGRAVEVVAEGHRVVLERLLNQLREGPRASHVQSLEIHWGPATGLHGDFGARF